ncbi:MAG: L,D-transpeptidase family protein [Thermoleophilaceae bacterium]|nr:L,D-transpeptidase family protein [Thermoleophilaceae bacterium]
MADVSAQSGSSALPIFSRAPRALATLCAGILLGVSAFVATPAHAADGPTGPTGGATGPTGGATAPDYVDTELSDEATLSRYAFVEFRVTARAEPDVTSRAVKKLTTRTPDGTSELVLVLTERRLSSGIRWVKVRLPMRPNNTTGWVPRRALSAYKSTRLALYISHATKKATLKKNGKTIWSAGVGLGQRKWPTPLGNFYIRDKLIVRGSGGPYGPFAFGLSAYSKVLTDWPGGGMIGIHGTNEPGLIPGRISHGCIRVKNAKIRKLERLITVGTPVIIS